MTRQEQEQRNRMALLRYLTDAEIDEISTREGGIIEMIRRYPYRHSLSVRDLVRSGWARADGRPYTFDKHSLRTQRSPSLA